MQFHPSTYRQYLPNKLALKLEFGKNSLSMVGFGCIIVNLADP
jgi:hypothetical protein